MGYCLAEENKTSEAKEIHLMDINRLLCLIGWNVNESQPSLVGKDGGWMSEGAKGVLGSFKMMFFLPSQLDILSHFITQHKQEVCTGH